MKKALALALVLALAIGMAFTTNAATSDYVIVTSANASIDVASGQLFQIIVSDAKAGTTITQSIIDGSAYLIYVDTATVSSGKAFGYKAVNSTTSAKVAKVQFSYTNTADVSKTVTVTVNIAASSSVNAKVYGINEFIAEEGTSPAADTAYDIPSDPTVYAFVTANLIKALPSGASLVYTGTNYIITLKAANAGTAGTANVDVLGKIGVSDAFKAANAALSSSLYVGIKDITSGSMLVTLNLGAASQDMKDAVAGGKTLKVYDANGKATTYTAVITDGSIILTNVPVGSYIVSTETLKAVSTTGGKTNPGTGK